MSTPVLTVQNFTVGFKNTDKIDIVVKHVGFSVYSGKITAIVGESGSGKSLTALSIMNLQPKEAIVSGEILYHSGLNNQTNILLTNPAKTNEWRGNKISMIFQEPMTSLNPAFTCGYQVTESILRHQKLSATAAKAKTIELFKKVHLPNPENIIHRYPHELSGGQKQRVMIAMAICCNPAVLIADEPTTALDVTVQKKILGLLQELQQENGMAVILISHDLGLVTEFSDQVIVMQKGVIVEQGNVATITQDPQQSYTKALLACQPARFKKGKRLPVAGDYTESQNSLQEIQAPIEKEPQLLGAEVLKVENLKVYFSRSGFFFKKSSPPVKAVDDVSFTIQKGETVGLVGESGCGKTTLVKSILQLVNPVSGSIILNGRDLAQYTSKQLQNIRKDLQIVFQDPYGSLNPRLTIGNAIAEPMQVHSVLQTKNERKDKVIELLEKVDLKADHFNRYPHQFSGGQRQRICIARALSLNPSFLIFDESVSALDVSVQAQVLNLINDLKDEFGFSSIFISHNLAVVHYISNRIMVMHQGKIVEEGGADKIYFSPENKYTQMLIEAIPGKKMATI